MNYLLCFVALFCNLATASPKNLLIWELRKDYTHVDHVQNGAEIHKQPVQGIMYYRQNVLDTIGAGVGIDANNTIKLAIGIGF